MGPMCYPGFGSRLHSPMAKACIRSMEERRKIVQDFWCGNGKRELKRVSSAWSSVQCHFFLLPKGCEGMSVIEFFSAAM